MRAVVKFAGAALLLPVLLGTPALAQDKCAPLKLMASLPMTQPEGSDRVMVDILVNDTKQTFLFDTGGVFPQISSAVADELKLHTVQSRIELYGANGAVSRTTARVDSLQMGAVHVAGLDLQISPFNDNIFSPLVFPSIDFDMDFAGRKLNLISSDHCDGKVVYWPAATAAVVDVRVQNYRITVPVTVDGHPLTALIDTGAATSTMRLDIAQSVFGLTPGTPDMPQAGHLGDNAAAIIYDHPFKNLSFGGIGVTNPRIRILTDVVNENADHRNQTGSMVRRASDHLVLPEVIVGMDVLKHLHVYLAQKEQRLYITAASAPTAAAAPADAAAAGTPSP